MGDKTFTIFEGLNLNLGSVTPRSLKILDEIGLGLTDPSSMKDTSEVGDDLPVEQQRLVTEVYLNSAKLKKLLIAIFRITEEQWSTINDNIEDIKLDAVMDGYWDFFGKLNPPLDKWTSLLNNFKGLK